ncbi:MAG: hypothetical protein AAFN77_11920 [Planctomycetota bacterium]
MKYYEALNTILLHGVGRSDVPLDEAIMDDGFIGCLRPWTGLRDENYRELMRAIVSLHDSLGGMDSWPKDLILALFGITRMTHCWALDDSGMLRRNNLVTDAEIAKLRGWIQRIESVVEQLLIGNDPLETFPKLREVVGQ